MERKPSHLSGTWLSMGGILEAKALQRTGKERKKKPQSKTHGLR